LFKLVAVAVVVVRLVQEQVVTVVQVVEPQLSMVLLQQLAVAVVLVVVQLLRARQVMVVRQIRVV
jgi:hypothetical protein